MATAKALELLTLHPGAAVGQQAETEVPTKAFQHGMQTGIQRDVVNQTLAEAALPVGWFARPIESFGCANKEIAAGAIAIEIVGQQVRNNIRPIRRLGVQPAADGTLRSSRVSSRSKSRARMVISRTVNDLDHGAQEGGSEAVQYPPEAGPSMAWLR